MFELFLIIGVFICERSDLMNRHTQERSTNTNAASNTYSSNPELEKSIGEKRTIMTSTWLELNI